MSGRLQVDTTRLEPVVTDRSPHLLGLEITYRREVATQDLAPLLDELANDFLEYTIVRKNIGSVSAGLTPQIGTEVLLAGAASAFLAELGKDVYRGVRQGLYHA